MSSSTFGGDGGYKTSILYNEFGNHIDNCVFKGELVFNKIGNYHVWARIDSHRFRNNIIQDFTDVLYIMTRGTTSTLSATGGIFNSLFESNLDEIIIELVGGTHESITIQGESRYLLLNKGFGVSNTNNIRSLTVEKGTVGLSSNNPFQLHDSALETTLYPKTIRAAGTSTRILLLWANDTGGFTGKYKNSNALTTATWTDL
jgi:hypothetical protein